MARARNIKPGFFMNEDLAELLPETRLLFIGLWTLADREGRLEDRPKRINAALFPFDSFNIESMLTQLQTNKFIVRYEVDGHKYIQILNFVKHQDPHYKEKASEIPGPEGHGNFIKATAVTRTQRARIMERDEYKCRSCGSEDALCIDHIVPASRGGDSSDENLQVLCHSCNTKKGNKLDGEDRGIKKSKHDSTSLLTRFNVEPNLNQRIDASPSDSLIPDSLIPDSSLTSVSEGSQSAKPPATTRGSRLDPEWVLPRTWGEWALQEFPHWTPDVVRAEASKFKDHWLSESGAKARKVDWLATWRKWCRSDICQRSHPPPGQTSETPYARQMRERVAEAAGSFAHIVAAKAPGQQFKQTPAPWEVAIENNRRTIATGVGGCDLLEAVDDLRSGLPEPL